MKFERRRFITSGIAATAVAIVSRLRTEDSRASTPGAAPKAAPAERVRPPPQEAAQVLRFVQAGHGDLAKVKEMVTQDEKLVLAAWDWGSGDWETRVRRSLARWTS
jgi:hypothetical protein